MNTLSTPKGLTALYVSRKTTFFPPQSTVTSRRVILFSRQLYLTRFNLTDSNGIVPLDLPIRVEAVAMDMSAPYVTSIREHLPGGEKKIVFDKFHSGIRE